MRKTILLAATACMLAATPALADPAVCIRHDDIFNWSPVDDKHLVLENSHHQKALMTLIGTCNGFKYLETIEIRSPGASDLSCIDRGDTVRTNDFGFRGTCAISKIEPYTGPVGSHKHDDHSTDHTDSGAHQSTDSH